MGPRCLQSAGLWRYGARSDYDTQEMAIVFLPGLRLGSDIKFYVSDSL